MAPRSGITEHRKLRLVPEPQPAVAVVPSSAPILTPGLARALAKMINRAATTSADQDNCLSSDLSSKASWIALLSMDGSVLKTNKIPPHRATGSSHDPGSWSKPPKARSSRSSSTLANRARFPGSGDLRHHGCSSRWPTRRAASTALSSASLSGRSTATSSDSPSQSSSTTA